MTTATTGDDGGGRRRRVRLGGGVERAANNDGIRHRTATAMLFSARQGHTIFCGEYNTYCMLFLAGVVRFCVWGGFANTNEKVILRLRVIGTYVEKNDRKHYYSFQFD